MKAKFITWMKTEHNGRTYKDSTISRSVRALEKLCAQIQNLNIESTDLFFYKDLNSFKKVDAVITVFNLRINSRFFSRKSPSTILFPSITFTIFKHGFSSPQYS